MYFPSYAVGEILRAEIESGCYVLTGSEQNCHVNLIKGDEIFIIKHDGVYCRDTFRGISKDLNTINLEKSGEINIHSLIFIGRVD